MMKQPFPRSRLARLVRLCGVSALALTIGVLAPPVCAQLMDDEDQFFEWLMTGDDVTGGDDDLKTVQIGSVPGAGLASVTQAVAVNSAGAVSPSAESVLAMPVRQAPAASPSVSAYRKEMDAVYGVPVAPQSVTVAETASLDGPLDTEALLGHPRPMAQSGMRAPVEVSSVVPGEAKVSMPSDPAPPRQSVPETEDILYGDGAPSSPAVDQGLAAVLADDASAQSAPVDARHEAVEITEDLPEQQTKTDEVKVIAAAPGEIAPEDEAADEAAHEAVVESEAETPVPEEESGGSHMTDYLSAVMGSPAAQAEVVGPKIERGNNAVDAGEEISALAQYFIFGDDGKAGTLTLEEAIMLALDNSPQIKAQNEQIVQAGYALDEIKADLLPDVQMTLEYGRKYIAPAGKTEDGENDGDQTMFDRKTLVMRQMLFDGRRTSSEIKRQKRLIERTELDKASVIETIIINTIEAYLNVLQYQKTAADAQGFIEDMQYFTDKIKEREEIGDISRSRLELADSRLAAAKTAYQNAQAFYTQALSDLEFLTGALPEFRAVRPAQFAADAYDLESYLAHAEHNNTNLLTSDTNKLILQQALRAQRSRFYPEVDFQVRMDEQYLKSDEPEIDRQGQVGVQMNWVLFDGFSGKAEENRLRSDIKELEYQRQDLWRQMRRDITRSYNQIGSLREALKSLDKDISSNKAVQAINRESFQLGDVDLFELIEEEQRLFTTRSQKNQFERDRYLNDYQLLLTSGILNYERFGEFITKSLGGTMPVPDPLAVPKKK